jgi:hypothetical protein
MRSDRLGMQRRASKSHTDAAPNEWESALEPSKQDPSEVSGGGWTASSLDLNGGMDVIEGDCTIPGELLEQLFWPSPKGSGAEPF